MMDNNVNDKIDFSLSPAEVWRQIKVTVEIPAAVCREEFEWKKLGADKRPHTHLWRHRRCSCGEAEMRFVMLLPYLCLNIEDANVKNISQRKKRFFFLEKGFGIRRFTQLKTRNSQPETVLTGSSGFPCSCAPNGKHGEDNARQRNPAETDANGYVERGIFEERV